MEGVVQEDFGLEHITTRSGEDLVLTSLISTLCTWECFTGPQERFFDWNPLDRKDTFRVASLWSQEFSSTSSGTTLANEDVAMVGSRDCATSVSDDYLLAMFATMKLGSEVGLPVTGTTRVGHSRG